MKQKLSVIRYYLCAVCLCCASFCAASDLPELVLLTENYPPYQYIEDERVIGIRVDLVTELLNQSGLKYRIEMLPWARGYKTASTVKNRCIFSTIRLPMREKSFAWIGSIGATNGGFFTLLSRRDVVVEEESDLKKYTIAIPRGGITQVMLEARGFTSGKELLLVRDIQQAIDLVIRGRADLIVSNQKVIEYSMQLMNLPIGKLKFVYTLPEFARHHLHYIACHPDTHPRILNILSRTLSDIKKLGIDKQIEQSWLQR